MERFWNPEFLEEGQDPRKSWTLCNMNVLTKNTGYYNPEFGTYTLRGINVKVEKASRPEGVWHERPTSRLGCRNRLRTPEEVMPSMAIAW